MKPWRKMQLRREYLAAERVVERKLGEIGCGLELLKHISVDVSEACQVMDRIRDEVKAAMEAPDAPST